MCFALGLLSASGCHPPRLRSRHTPVYSPFSLTPPHLSHSSPEVEESSRSRVKALTDAWRRTEAAATAAAAAAAGRGGRGRGGGSAAGGGGAAETAAIHKDLPVLATVMAQEGGGGEEVAATVGWPRQLRLLLVRSWRQVVRDRATIASRAVANVSRCAGRGGVGRGCTGLATDACRGSVRDVRGISVVEQWHFGASVGSSEMSVEPPDCPVR